MNYDQIVGELYIQLRQAVSELEKTKKEKEEIFRRLQEYQAENERLSTHA